MLASIVWIGCDNSPSGGTSQNIGLSATGASFVAGQGNISKARTLLNVTTAGVAIKRVTRNGATLSDHRLFIDDGALKIGNRDNTGDTFTLGDATGDLKVLLGASGYTDVSVDVKVQYGVALFEAVSDSSPDNGWQGGFGYSRCYQFLNNSHTNSKATALRTRLLNDGYAASTARFFGSQTRDENVDGQSGNESRYPFNNLGSVGLGFSATNDPRLLNRPVVSYTHAAALNSRLGIQNFIKLNGSSPHNFTNSATTAAINRLVGNGIYWSYTFANGNYNATNANQRSASSCSHATSNTASGQVNSAETGNKNVIAIAGRSQSDYLCDRYYHVLCVAK